MRQFSVVAAPLISVWLYKLAIKTAQTVYNHTGYARNYNANCSIILFRGYYFYSREFTIYIFFPPLSSYLNRKQTFMKFSHSWNFRRLPLLLLLMKYKINKNVYKIIMFTTIAFFGIIYIYRMMCGSGDIVVFKPREGLLFRFTNIFKK